MSQTLEYILSLKDLVSAKLQKIGIANDAMLNKFAKLEKQQQKVSSAFKDMGTSVHTLQKKISLLKSERDLLPVGSLSSIRKYNSEINKLERNVTKLQTLNGSKVKTWFQDALNGLPGVMTNPLVLIGAGVGASVRKGMEADMQKANILTLVKGNADKAKKLYQDISQYGIKTPYEKQDILEAQKTMMSFGIDANYAFGKMKNIGDIALGDAGKMQSLSLAFAQAASSGKLQGQDLNQMINAGFNPLQIISERTGESMASLKERMSKGGISAKELGQAFEWATDKQGQFYQGAEKASQTLAGKWSNMLDALSELALKVYDVVSPIITPAVELISTLFNAIGSGIGWLVDKFKEGNPYIIIAASVVGAFTTALILHNTYTSLAAFFQNKLTWAVIKTNLAFLANPITWVIASIVALIAVIGYAIYETDGWGKAWDVVVNNAKLTWDYFTSAARLAWVFTVNSFMTGINRIKTAWYSFKNAIGLGDKNENNAALKAIADDTKQRIEEVLKAKKQYDKAAYNASKNRKNALDELSWNNKSFKDVKNSITSSLGIPSGGIKPASIPGLDNGLGGTGKKRKKGKLGHELGKSSQATATGGTKHNYITINLKDLVGSITISGKDFKETTTQLQQQVEDALMRTLASAETAGS